MIFYDMMLYHRITVTSYDKNSLGLHELGRIWENSPKAAFSLDAAQILQFISAWKQLQ